MVLKTERPYITPETEIQSGSQGTVLLVDDEDIIRQLGIRILEKSGYKVIAASNGHEGVTTYKDHHDEIDVVILDMSMPGMNGMETMAVIKRDFPSAKIMISTGHSLEGELETLKKEGFCDILMKPYRAHELASKVREAIDKK